MFLMVVALIVGLVSLGAAQPLEPQTCEAKLAIAEAVVEIVRGSRQDIELVAADVAVKWRQAVVDKQALEREKDQPQAGVPE